jgi:hypothetical protein
MPILPGQRAQISKTGCAPKVPYMILESRCVLTNKNNRHVRVHHADKDIDDPLIRGTLNQRSEDAGRGRRRRIA